MVLLEYMVIEKLTKDNFEEFISEGKVIVDFWAPWCGPCKVIAPNVEEAAEELKGKVKFGKVNVDEETELAQKYEVMSIPALIFFKNKDEVARTAGVMSKEEIVTKSEESF